MNHRPILSRRLILSILILALASQACAISLFEWPFPSNVTGVPPTPSGPTATPAPRAKVTFTVRLPEPLVTGEFLVISVVDEVTGLALNAVDYQMNPIDAVTYTTDLDIPELGAPPVHAVFIRAPWVEEAGDAVEVLARVEHGAAAGRIVAVRQGPLMATSFHPELTDDLRVHELFVEMVREDANVRA